MKKLIVTVIFVIALSLFSFAQNAQTPYQKKQFELAKKYFQIFYGYQMTMSESVFFEQIAEGKEVRDFLLGLGILSYAMEHSEAQVEYVLAQMEKEYEAAEKLKNETDFRLEKEAKDLKAKKDYKNTDVEAIRKNVKSKFEKWNTKGEFEKESYYIERLKNESQTVFDSICMEQIKARVDTISDSFHSEILLYNSEDEFFPLKFEFNNIEWQCNLNVPIAQAENFKKNFYDINFEIDEYDWVYVGDRLCPTLLTTKYPNSAKFQWTPKYKLPVTLSNTQTEITLPFDSLEIVNKYLDGYVFKLSEAKQRKYARNTDQLTIIEDASIVYVSYINVLFLDGRDKESNKSSKIWKLKINFTLSANKLVSSGSKTVYIRIKRPDGSYISSGGTFTVGDSQLSYTDSRNIIYDNNQTLNVSVYHKLTETLSFGEYLVGIYMDGNKIGESSFLIDEEGNAYCR